MNILFICITLFGQVEVGVPPAPAADPPAATATSAGETVEDLRTWLLTRLIVDMQFDAQKSADVERMINNMNERQLRVLIGVYKERAAATKAQQETSQQLALEQGKLNLQRAEAYRDDLKREYDRRLLNGYMTQNLFYQNRLNNQMLMNGGFGYGMAYGYGGGYGYGYGVPAYGSAMYYASPYYGSSYYGGMGTGFW